MPDRDPATMTDRPKAFLFDVFGTVVDWRGSMIREVGAAMEAVGASIDVARFVDEWRGLYQPSMEAVRAGARAWTILDVLHRESLDTLLAQYGVAERFDDAARTTLSRGWARLDPWPDSVEGVTRLKAIGFVATCSNGDIALMAHMAKRAGLPWDAILGAEPTLSYKPMPETYLGSCRRLYLAPGECMMVAAHAEDLAAARSNGLKTAFIARPLEYGPDGPFDPTWADGWDYAATGVDDLAAQLGA